MLPFVASLVLAVNVISPRLAHVTGEPHDYYRISDIRESAAQKREDAAARREEVMNNLQTRRQEAIDNAKARLEEFRAKVNEIKDQRKQRIVTNLAERFGSVNEKWTAHWSRVLSRFSEILAKMEERVGHIAEETGKDVSGAQDAISAAEAAVAGAQEAVAAQAGKTYVPEIDSEATVGENVRSLVEEFHADLRATLEHVKTARQAMTDALSSMKSLAEDGGDSEGEAHDEE